MYKTFKITYASYKSLQKYYKLLDTNPRIACVTEHPDLDHKCEDLSKPIITLFYMVKENLIKSEAIEDILHAIFSEVLGRYYPTDVLLSNFFDIEKE